MALQRSRTGLLAGCDRYRPLRAFAQGGSYWDAEPQRLLRAGNLGEFLPRVEWVDGANGRSARFHCGDAGRDRLGRSRPLGSVGVPPDQIERLRHALIALAAKATDPDTQPQNRTLLAGFCLPDIARAPELFRVSGPFWNRRLHILWGCETAPGASLPALLALKKLPVDRAYVGKRRGAAAAAAIVFAGLLMCAASLVRPEMSRSSIPPMRTSIVPSMTPEAPSISADRKHAEPTVLVDDHTLTKGAPLPSINLDRPLVTQLPAALTPPTDPVRTPPIGDLTPRVEVETEQSRGSIHSREPTNSIIGPELPEPALERLELKSRPDVVGSWSLSATQAAAGIRSNLSQVSTSSPVRLSDLESATKMPAVEAKPRNRPAADWKHGAEKLMDRKP